LKIIKEYITGGLKPKSINLYLFAAFITILSLIPVWTSDPTILNVFIYTFLFAFYAASWSILGKYAGQISIGHSVYFGLGAYTTVLLYVHYNVSPWLGMFVGGLLAAMVAMLLGLPCFRLRGLFYIFATLAFAEVVRIIFLHPLRDLSGGAEGIPFTIGYTSPYYFQFVEKWPYYYIALTMMILLIAGLQKMEKSRLGYYLKAICEDEDAAEAIGINVLKYKLIAAGISGFLTAIAGTFYVQFLCYIGVNDVFGIMRSIEPVIISWVGGSGVFGPILGSFIITPITEFLVLTLGMTTAYGLHMILYGAILIIIVLFMPEGVIKPLSQKFYIPLLKKLSEEYRRV